MADNEDYDDRDEQYEHDEDAESPEQYPSDQLHHYDDNGDYDDQGEDNEYRSPGDQENNTKFLGAAKARKKAEEDSRLLANRIALLKLEERKAWK